MIPKVTIIMATFNRAHYIVETLQSIQEQTFDDWECLIIDDGGTDETAEVVAPFLKEDQRFQFLNRPENYIKGLPGSRNYGLDLAKGDYIIFFDDDDIIHPENLNTCMKVLDNSDAYFCHYQKLSFVDIKPIIEIKPTSIQQRIIKTDIEKIVTHKILFASCTVMWKKTCFETIRFNEKLLYAEEWECYCRLIAEGYEGIVIENVLYFNRKHLNSNTGEFYSNNPIRRASKKEAILLVVQNLNNKGLLSNSLLRYFIQGSLGFKEYSLFDEIMNSIKLTPLKKIKSHFFYFTLPLNLLIYKKWKNIKKHYN